MAAFARCHRWHDAGHAPLPIVQGLGGSHGHAKAISKSDRIAHIGGPVPSKRRSSTRRNYESPVGGDDITAREHSPDDGAFVRQKNVKVRTMKDADGETLGRIGGGVAEPSSLEVLGPGQEATYRSVVTVMTRAP